MDERRVKVAYADTAQVLPPHRTYRTHHVARPVVRLDRARSCSTHTPHRAVSASSSSRSTIVVNSFATRAGELSFGCTPRAHA